MNSKIKIEGIADLKEIYRSPKDCKYFFVVSVKAQKSDKYSPTNINFEVQITPERYKELKKLLSESNAERPILRIEGDLEIKVGSVCIN